MSEENAGAQPDAPVTETLDAPEAASSEAPKADVDWMAEARKWEKRAKDNAARLKDAEPIVAEWQRLQEASKTEQERLEERAKAAEERAASTLHRVAAAEVKAALTGVVDNPAAIMEDLNLGKFITAEGEVDSEAITALRGKYAQFATPAPRMQPNPAQGKSAVPPLGLNDRIAEARKNGDIKTAIRLEAEKAIQRPAIQ